MPGVSSAAAGVISSGLSSSIPSATGAFSSFMPAIGAGLDAAGGFLGGLFNANQARKNRQFQERMYNKQVEDNIRFWEMQNRYNLPSAMKQRLEDAGLNSLLMYGSGGQSMVAASPVQAAQAPNGSQASMSAHTNFGQALAQSALIQAQIRNINADSLQKETAAESNRVQAEGQNIFNWINDKTKNVQVALKYGDYDYVRQLIDESRNRVFQSSFVNAHQMAALSLQNSLAIRYLNIHEYQVGNNVMQGWENVLNGRISASAQMKNATAAMMNAVNAAKLVPYQIGVLRNNAALLYEQAEDIRQFRPERKQGLVIANLQARKNLSWTDFINEQSVLDSSQKRILMHIQSDQIQQDMDWKVYDESMKPFNALIGFGAGMQFGSNAGRTVVTGFGR